MSLHMPQHQHWWPYQGLRQRVLLHLWLVHSSVAHGHPLVAQRLLLML
jgi:hypothetical protein